MKKKKTDLVTYLGWGIKVQNKRASWINYQYICNTKHEVRSRWMRDRLAYDPELTWKWYVDNWGIEIVKIEIKEIPKGEKA